MKNNGLCKLCFKYENCKIKEELFNIEFEIKCLKSNENKQVRLFDDLEEREQEYKRKLKKLRNKWTILKRQQNKCLNKKLYLHCKEDYYLFKI